MAEQTVNLNSLDWWKASLAGNAPTFDPNVPSRGWYRGKRKGEDYKPIAYWYNDKKELVCLWGGKEIDEEQARKLWLWAHKNPISYKVYQDVIAGKPWPDIDPTVAAAKLAGHNDPPDDPLDAAKRKIELAGAGVSKYAEIEDDETAAKAQTLRSHLLQLQKDTDNKREALKRPFWEEVKSLDGRWMPVVKSAKSYADKLREYLSKYETSKLRCPPAPDQEQIVYSTTIKGASGRAASVRKRRIAKKITNLEALLHSIKDLPEFEAAVLAIAQKILDRNEDVLGCLIEVEADIR